MRCCLLCCATKEVLTFQVVAKTYQLFMKTIILPTENCDFLMLNLETLANLNTDTISRNHKISIGYIYKSKRITFSTKKNADCLQLLHVFHWLLDR